MPGEAIPDESPPQGKKLDAVRIASIQQNTDRVSAVLADIFSVEADEEEVAGGVSPRPLPGLTKSTPLSFERSLPVSIGRRMSSLT